MDNRIHRLKSTLISRQEEQQASKRQRIKEDFSKIKIRNIIYEAGGELVTQAMNEWNNELAQVKSFLTELEANGIVSLDGNPVKFGYGYFSRYYEFKADEDESKCSIIYDNYDFLIDETQPLNANELGESLLKIANPSIRWTNGAENFSIFGKYFSLEDAREVIPREIGSFLLERLGANQSLNEILQRIYGDIDISAIEDNTGINMEFQEKSDSKVCSINLNIGPMLSIKSGNNNSLEIPGDFLKEYPSMGLDNIEEFLEKNTMLAYSNSP